VFELARLAGVKVNQVYLWQTKHDRSANAAAAVGNKVLITDYLLQNMSKRQVDYVVAHELAHLRHRHPGMSRSGGGLVWVAIVLIYTAFYASQVLARFYPPPPVVHTLMQGQYGFLLLLVMGAFWAGNFQKRRNEFVADRDAVAIVGGDVEAAVQALVKLARLNAQPEQWGRLDAGLLTHPSQSRRIRAVLDANDVDPARLPAILAAVDRDEDHYPLPTDLSGEEHRLLTDFQSRRALVNQWTALAFFVLLPAVLAAVFHSRAWTGAAGLAAGGGGVLLSLLVKRTVNRYAGVWSEGRFRERCGALWKNLGIDVEALQGVFVGLAPAHAPRMFGARFDWDYGFLVPAGDRLCYLGCQTRFALPFHRVKAVRVGPGGPSWGKSKRVYLTWCDDGGKETTWNLRPAGVIPVRGVASQIPPVLRTLQYWQQAAPAAGPPPEPLSSLPAPAFGKVTSVTVAAFLRLNPVWRQFGRYAFGSAGLAFLFGCPLLPLPTSGWLWYAPALTCLMLAFPRIPYWLYREPRLPNSPGVPSSEPARAGA
jgi:hypothetical protein